MSGEKASIEIVQIPETMAFLAFSSIKRPAFRGLFYVLMAALLGF
jgi:hypothetical protein